MEGSVMRILERALGGISPTREECVRLLRCDEGSLEAGYMRATAAQVLRSRNENSAIILGQIGVETDRCPGNCRFCTFGEGHTGFPRMRMGAEELLAVDVDGVGVTLPNLTGLPTVMVRSYWELGDILHFDPDTARRNIELGYYDTRRAMGYLRGCAYAVSCDAQSCADAAAFHAKFERVQKAVREKYPVTLTADAALLLANMKDAQLAPLEAAAEDAGVDPTVFYTTRTLAEAFLEKCDRERIESFAPLFEGSGNAAQAARAALLPNTFLQALVCRALTGPVLPEVIEE